MPDGAGARESARGCGQIRGMQRRVCRCGAPVIRRVCVANGQVTEAGWVLWWAEGRAPGRAAEDRGVGHDGAK